MQSSMNATNSHHKISGVQVGLEGYWGSTDKAKHNTYFMAYGGRWNVWFLGLLAGHSDDVERTKCLVGRH